MDDYRHTLPLLSFKVLEDEANKQGFTFHLFPVCGFECGGAPLAPFIMRDGVSEEIPECMQTSLRSYRRWLREHSRSLRAQSDPSCFQCSLWEEA